MKRRIWLSMLLLLAVLAITGCGSSGSGKTDKIIGSVNGDNITQAEYDNSYKIRSLYYDQQMKQYLASNQSNGVKMSDDKTPEVIKQLKEQAWNDLVVQKLVLQDAAKQGIEISEELDKETGSDEYKKFIADNKLDADLYRESLKTQYLYNQMEKKYARQINVSDKEISDYYQANISKFQQPGGIEIYHILVNDEKLANDILAQLKKGADFAALAKEYSTCPSKDKGGDLGLGNQETQWDDTFKKAALALKPGEMTSAPVHTQFGYHIIKAGAKKEGETRSLADSRNQISMTLQEEKEKKAFADYLDGLKKKATIKDLRTTAKTDKSTESK